MEGKAHEEIISKDEKEGIQKILQAMVSPVRLVLFTQKTPCPTCAIQQQLLQDLSSISDMIKLEVHDLIDDQELADRYGVDKVPATLVLGEKDNGIRFYGMTMGFEFPSLLSDIIMVSTGITGLPPQLESLVRMIDKDVHIEIMTTLTCPYCPKIVHAAHQFALLNDKVRADMIELNQYPQLVQKYHVYTVPKGIINGTNTFDGAIPPEALYLEILKAVEPEVYQQVEKEIKGSRVSRKMKNADPEHQYEVIVVGGGPAAMSAAIYAVRKGLDVAVVADKLGGQITSTGIVENYLGLQEADGNDMAEIFRQQMESFDISEHVISPVVSVKVENGIFLVECKDGKVFKAGAVIFCTGKEYRRLGVPNEENLIGKGISFCAECDAPLFRGDRVAIVGGGNSAFTAARDLLHFAREVHIIHRRSEMTADASLAGIVLKDQKVAVHAPMIVKEFLGQETLTGVRMASPDGKQLVDLPVEGVFLEIGLDPNSAPLRGLIALNQKGEVPVGRDQSTEVPGLFAAGDVTDVPEKQISVAVGQGAIAGISAHRYLVTKGLTQSRIGLKDNWQ